MLNVSAVIYYILCKTYCMPAKHRLCTVALSRRNYWTISYVAWQKAVRGVWKISPQTHWVPLPPTCNDSPVEFQMCKRCLNFYRHCQTVVIALSTVVNNISVLWLRHKYDKTNVDGSKLNVPVDLTLAEESRASVHAIRDFALYWDSLSICHYNNVIPRISYSQDILTHLCTT